MKLPEPTDTTVKRIYASWENKERPRHSRRLGASQIGRPCDRELWYSFRWARLSKFEGRMLRLFAKGYIEETAIGEDLKRIGVEFHPIDEDTGEQYEASELGDHFVSKLDGVAVGFVEAPASWHSIEIKTANETTFNKIVKEGCKKAKPEHYAQIIAGLGMNDLDRAAYIVVNKNTEEIYMERIAFDKTEYKRLMQRAKEIIFAKDAPDRINSSPAWYQCIFCNFHNICHDGGGVAEKNCRTCQHSEPIEYGGWGCLKQQIVLDTMEACPDHEYHPDMACASAVKAAVMFNGKLTLDPENLGV